MSCPHPYREPDRRSEPPPPPNGASDARIDDVFLAAILLVVGALGVGVGIVMDHATELTLGLILIALAGKVAWEARQISI